jgi:ubiquinone/menaquinone biosynthesis C-methylase UbiE
MKTRESGMPDEQTWESFFDPALILARLGLTAACGCVVEFGCGYGTFTIPAARIISGTLHAIDIDAEMIAATKKKAETAGLHNVQVRLRDFLAEGTGLPSGSADYAMLFNILHAEQPMILLEEAYRVLSLGGKVGIVHWNHDPSTPRGPSMSIRPRPEQCAAWAEQAGFQRLPSGIISLPPYHYGMILKKAGGDCWR